MRALHRSAFRILLVLVLPAAIAACAPAPIYKTGPSGVNATPQQVATSPANFRNLQVVWGGSVISVHNLADHSEVEILAYPLDSSQRPRLKEPPIGRFIAVLPGFVEPMNYPPGSLVTLHGRLDGARSGEVGQAGYTYALVDSDAMHRWTPDEMRQGHPNISIGVGVGGWIH
ncbi:MAG TPA: Slp family lipoprotein [Rhodanobacteraceae bacterium]|jgi:outer membrane lipoprotein|nr:Slp family lipoprotein [Rhodanobacteraceae bacterium]